MQIQRTLKLAVYIIAFLVYYGCKDQQETEHLIPQNIRPEWRDLDTSKLELKFGDILRLTNGATKMDAIVLDFDKETSGIWYGICFIQNDSLFGRKIPSGISGGCLELLDLTYFQLKKIQTPSIIDFIDVDIRRVGIGSITAVEGAPEIFAAAQRARAERRKKQTPCEQKTLKLNPVNECYLPLAKIKR